MLDETMVSPHFAWSEARCHDGTDVPPEYRENARTLALELERIRAACLGRPLTVTSWYRTPVYNARVGGASGSEHLKARAADLVPSASMTPRALFDRIRRLKVLHPECQLTFVKLYRGGWVHVHIRPGQRFTTEIET